MVNWYRSVNNAFVYKITRLQKVVIPIIHQLTIKEQRITDFAYITKFYTDLAWQKEAVALRQPLFTLIVGRSSFVVWD